MPTYQIGRAEVNQLDGSVDLPDGAVPIGFEKQRRAGWEFEYVVYAEEVPA